MTTAPQHDLIVSEWLNTDTPLSLSALRGKIVVVEAFQMLCPGCVSHGLPQAQTIQRTFPTADVTVIGLHSVFEHHAAMGPASLKAFVHEYSIPFPVGIDLAVAGSSIPQSMQTYKLRGTPSLVVVDRNGYVRLNHFGHLDDMLVGALLGQLI